MPSRSSSRDPRAQRSRSAIADAALALLRDHDPGDITVTSIASAAQVSRQTVYQQFTDASDALGAAVVLAMQEALPDERTTGPAEALRALLRFAVENVDLYDKLRSSRIAAQLQDRFTELLAPHVGRLAGEATADTPRVAFLVGGVVQLIGTWSADPTAFDLETATVAELRRAGARVEGG